MVLVAELAATQLQKSLSAVDATHTGEVSTLPKVIRHLLLIGSALLRLEIGMDTQPTLYVLRNRLPIRCLEKFFRL